MSENSLENLTHSIHSETADSMRQVPQIFKWVHNSLTYGTSHFTCPEKVMGIQEGTVIHIPQIVVSKS